MDNPICLERAEHKFEVGISQETLPTLWADVNRYMPVREFLPGQNITYNNTIYFDSEDCFLLRRGVLSRYDHMRIRARKYEYDSTSFPDSSAYWVELRIRKGDIRKKQRLKLEGRDLQGLLEGKEINGSILDYNRAHADSRLRHEVYKEIQDIIIEKSLRPVLLASYQRMAFENGGQRLTIDWGIQYHHVGASVFTHESLKDLPEKPAGCDQAVVLELKYTGDFPSWMSDIQEKYPIRSKNYFSKFDRGMKVLLEGPLRHREDSESLVKMMHAHKEKGWDLSGEP